MPRWTAALIACLFIVCGCGGGSGESGASAQAVSLGGGPTSTVPANVLINFQTSARAVPAYIQQFRCTGLSGSGAAVYGPRTFNKAAQVRLDNVPLNVITLRIEHLQGEAVRGLANISVTLRAGQTLELNDPDFDDVAAVLQGLLVEYPQGQIPVGLTQTIVAQATYNTGERQEVTASVNWTIEDPDILKIDGQGLLTAKKMGHTKVIANFASTQFQFNIEVGEAVLRGLKTTPTSLTLPVGISQTVSVEGTYSDGSRRILPASMLTFDVQNENLAQVDPQGLLTGQTPGSTTLVISEDGGLHVSVPVEIINAVPQRLRIETPSTVFPKGVYDQLRCIASFSDGSEVDVTAQVLWSSQETSVATISGGAEAGLVYARDLGFSTIKAELQNLETSILIEVSTAQPIELVIDPEIAITAGLSSQLKVVANYTDGTSREVTHEAFFSSSAPAIAQVNTTTSRGLVTGVAVGETEINVEFSGLQAKVATAILLPLIESIRINPETSYLAPGSKRAYRAFARYNNDTELEITEQATWSANSTFISQSIAGEFTVSVDTDQETTVEISASFESYTAVADLHLRRYIFVATNGVRVFSVALPSDFFWDGTSVGSTGPLQGLAIHPSGAYLFGVDSSSGSVRSFSVHPDRTLDEIGSPVDIGIGTGPVVNDPVGAITVHPSGEFLYVCNRNTNELWVLSIDDAGALTVQQGPVPVAAGPLQFAFDRDNQFLYLTNIEAEVVSSFRVSSNGTVSLIEVLDLPGTGPKSLTVDHEWNNLYVAHSLSNEVVMYRVQDDGRLARVSGSVSLSTNSPDVVVNGGGRLYVGSQYRGDGTIGTYDLQEAALPVFEQTKGYNGAITALAVDQANLDLYAVEYRPFGFADFLVRLRLQPDGTIGIDYHGRSAGTTIKSIVLSP